MITRLIEGVKNRFQIKQISCNTLKVVNMLCGLTFRSINAEIFRKEK